jgi:tRNA (pseudouridine54-N1)-methyltransferase
MYGWSFLGSNTSCVLLWLSAVAVDMPGKLMRVFVLRARAAPTDSAALLAGVGGDIHSEILAHALMNALFVAQSHRADVVVHLVLESTRDYSRTISFDSNALRELGGFHEQALLARIAHALDASIGMGKEESRMVEPGITVRTVSFEKLVQELAVDHALFVMDRKGTSIREQAFSGNPCFLSDRSPADAEKVLQQPATAGREEDQSGATHAVRLAVRDADPP